MTSKEIAKLVVGMQLPNFINPISLIIILLIRTIVCLQPQNKRNCFICVMGSSSKIAPSNLDKLKPTRPFTGVLAAADAKNPEMRNYKEKQM